MNKITLCFFRKKSKTIIKGLFLLFALFFMSAQVSWAQVNITPIRTDVAGFSTWTDTDPAGTTYLQLLKATSQTISPAMDFDGYTNETLNFKARTVGGVLASENILTVWISIDNGSNWTSLGTRTPTSSTMTAQTAFDISSYSGTQVKIKFTVGGTSSTIGVGIDDITVTGIVFSSGPEINIKGKAVSIVDGATPASTANDTDFGTLATNTGVTKIYTIENTGSTDLVLTAPYVQKSLATTVFSITQPSLTTIPTGNSTTFSVTFNSGTSGTFDEVIEVLSNDTDEGTYNFAIKAIAQSPVPNISLKGNSTIIAVGDNTPTTTDNTDFGGTATNTNVVKTYTIENTGTGSLTVNGILMSNNPASKYNIGGISFPATIAASGSTTFTVTFNSAVAGTFTDTVLIDNNDPTDSTYDFAVTAKAAILNFGVGDISIVGVTADTPDSFSFVNWVPIPASAQLNFTDNTWSGNALLENENTVVWENNTGNTIPVGTVIAISDNSGAALADTGTIVSGNLSGISSSNDNIFIYEGSAAEPYFIFGLSNAVWLLTYVTSTNTSMLPSSLNVTNGNIVTGEVDNVEYSGALALKDTKSSFAAYKTLVNDPTNWTKSNTLFALNSVDFELLAVWETAAWTDGLTPTSSLKAVLKDSYSTTTNGTFTAKKLTINAAKSLTINTGTNVTVQNEVINNGTLVVENNANLIQVNDVTNTGAITVNRNSNALKRGDYTLWSSPVASQNLAAFSPLTSLVPNRFYIYNPATDKYTNTVPAALDPLTTNFSPGVGYAIRMPNEKPGSLGLTTPYYLGNETLFFPGMFTGIPNNGDVSVSLSTAGQGYNLVGNPYPSAINLFTLKSNNNLVIGNTFYMWRKTNNVTGSAYCSYIPTTASTGTFVSNDNAQAPTTFVGDVQVGQGFFVSALTTGPLVFKNGQRVTTAPSFFKTKQAVESSKIWLNATNAAGYFSQMAVTYFDGATVGVDDFDGKYISDSAFALTSNINNGDYTIQGRPAFDASDVVALNFKTDAAGEYTIAIDHSEGVFASGQDIYLVDSKTGTETNLKNNSYTFAATAAVDNTRFSLKFQKTLSIDAPEWDDDSVLVYKNNGTIFVNSGAKMMNNIKVFDIQGKLIAEQKNVKTNAATISNLKVTNQALIVQITSEDNKTVNKKILN